MKNILRTACALVLALMLASPAQAAAADAAGNKYGFVNMDRVMHDSDAGQALRKELEVKGQQFQAELSKENKALSAERLAFEKGRAGMSREEVDKKLRELDAKYAEASKLLKERENTWKRANIVSGAQLKKSAVDIILELSKEQNYAAVFSQESVILAAQDYDITDEVIKRLNAKVKKVPVDWSGKKPADKK